MKLLTILTLLGLQTTVTPNIGGLKLDAVDHIIETSDKIEGTTANLNS